MKKLTLIVMLMVSYVAMAAGDTNVYYWVQFADKTGTPYTIDKPQAFLSERALQRRERLKIEVDSLDLPVNPDYVKAVSRTGAKIHNISKWLNGTTVIATPEQVKKIEGLKFVEYAVRYNKRAAMVDTTTMHYDAGKYYAAEQHKTYDSNYYNLAFSQISQMSGQTLHARGYEGQGIMVGVCDGGFPGVDTLMVFDSLRRSGRLLANRDFVAHQRDAFRSSSHGTMVLSNMAGYIPGLYVGTAPKASYVLCITEDEFTESPIEELNWATAVEWLDSMGVDVVNSSLGYLGFGDTTLSHHYSDLDGKTAWMSIAAEIAATRGILCVNSAGNEGRNGEHSVSVPADAEHLLSVGAVWRNGKITSFSSFGPTYDHRVKPDVCAQGIMVNVASPRGGYFPAAGTSFSSPIMAGIVACLRQAAPNASVDDVFRALRMSGDNAEHVNNLYGYGVPNCVKAMRMLRVGVGTRQLEQLKDGKPVPRQRAGQTEGRHAGGRHALRRQAAEK